MGNRLDRLREELTNKGLDAILVSNPDNRRYLSGFTGTAGYLLISSEEAYLATDFRYTEQAHAQAPHFQILRTSSNWMWLVELLSNSNLKKLGFESQHMTMDAFQTLRESVRRSPALGALSLAAVKGLVEGLRIVKDAAELALIQRAIDVADGAMEAVCPTIEPGHTEKEVAWRLEKAMRELGAESISFDTIVAAGPNGAMPHHQPTDYPISAREPVVIDMGAKVGGYCSDISRTICLGEPDDTFRRIYDIVLGSQLTAINTVQAGMTTGDADGLSRTVIAEAGYSDNFGHSLGHGVGLAIHESPGVGPNTNGSLEKGMVFTVEPGIYISGWGGVRIEDIVVLESGGARILTKASK